MKIPAVNGEIPHGDMPGDKVIINELCRRKAERIFEALKPLIADVCEKQDTERVVIAVCGGSGVGKSGVASLLSYYLKENGVGAYTMSGDNYPHRIPEYNDAERLRIFREGGMKRLAASDALTPERAALIREYQRADTDADPAHRREYGWYDGYLAGGRAALRDYLGTPNEIGFDEVEEIVRQFKSGEEEIWLRRLGREESELWYEKVDFSGIQVLLIEWTHGNSDNYRGVDIPVLLHSTPAETLAYRMARNRDGGADSPFVTMVLEIEQAQLASQAHKAKIIVSNAGELLSYEEYQKQMEG